MNSAQQYPEPHFSICFSTINHGASQTGRDIERLENKIKFQLLRKLREIHPHASDVGWNKDLVGQEDFLSDYLDHSSMLYIASITLLSPLPCTISPVTLESLKEGGA